MEKVIVISLIVLLLLNLVLVTMVYDLMIRVNDNYRHTSANFNNLKDWLFNQLYSMAPGKVLRPDEVEEVKASEPARVYNPSQDPMGEFRGEKNDWF